MDKQELKLLALQYIRQISMLDQHCDSEIKGLAKERLLINLSIIVKRLCKTAEKSPDCPDLEFWLKLKTNLLWNFNQLRPALDKKLQDRFLPRLQKFLEKQKINEKD